MRFLLLSMMMPLGFTPRILAFDTSTVRGSIALLEGREMRAEIRLQSVQTHSKQLLHSIDFLLGRIGWKLDDLQLVAAGNGPGSFTGIRIGIATALGIAHSLGIPFVEISGLDALAQQVPHLDGRIGVVMDAHRSQAFYAEYAAKNGRIRPTQKSTLIEISALEHLIRDRHLYLVGDPDICRLVGATTASSSWPRQVSVDLFLAAEIGRLACVSKRRWRSGDSITAEPLYIRPPDALKKRFE
jgi:tRNA threonylcarbamoyl adenosine modification protein YeaZ